VTALGLTLALWALVLSGLGARWIGFVFLAGIVAYIVWRYRHPGSAPPDDDVDAAPVRTSIAVLLFLGGLGVLVAGGNALVFGAIELATILAVPETVIGLTVVAVGTSLPELAASIAAALRGKAALALGNVVGSNIYNILLIGGVTMSIAPFPLPADLAGIQMALLTASAVILLALLWWGRRIGRVIGALLVAAFAGNVILVFS